MNDWLQWAIIAFIVLAIGFVVFRSGRANPASTGELGSKLNELSTQHVALKGRMGQIETELQDLKEVAASAKDIERLEEVIKTVRAEMTGHRELSLRTNHSVDRIERMLIEKALR